MSQKNLPLCPVSRTAFIIGSRWTSEIIRELVDNGPRRFSDFEAALPGRVFGGLVPSLLVDHARLPRGASPHVGTSHLDVGLQLALLDEGRYRRGATELVVSRGLGAVGLPWRVCCPPEGVLLRLVPRS